jgi:poly-gamma-glutamate capsule biosynthesis protein CapA/YwtB (metallophosphatase superfamily)
LEVLGVAVAVVHAAAAVSTAVAAAPAARPVRTRRPIGIARIAALTCSSLFEGQNSLTALNN